MTSIDLHVHLAPKHDGSPVGPPALYRPDEAEAYLDRAGLDEAVVSIPPPFFRQGQPGVAREVNDGLLDVTAGRSRLRPLAYLPFEDPEAAAEEYDRVKADARFVGVCGAAGGKSVSLADSRFGPLWKALDADARLLLLHPATSPDNRLDPFYLHNLLGNPIETAVATAQLVFGDVLARHPSLRVLLVHCGGCVPAVAGRWQRGLDTARPGVETLTEPPRLALRRIFVDCLAHDPAQVDHAIEVFGPDRIVLGSDWPFAMGIVDPRSQIAHRGPAFVEQVATTNGTHALTG
ncbi:aminocarboxymuconate-semialdehyde decarboxylase [Kibdelosporangium banguiense]|uniref:Aminocarboxymuconate-semialdehyde decarboxylase n=1 Tax=Kibdelosporangium banguiense TaxID=1365924 RepID=A0ABS4TTZ8_9PSEU|nr:amidohydrolase family protein [Kibdelosporangium banguiense]MBP2327869.1 aminocarboxymuconate-semialdehyde decarboxylase [Kibdelosporangium banguiense]